MNSFPLSMMKKPSKYRAQPTWIDGVRFDSKREAAHYGQLVYRLKAGEITALELHPIFDIRVNGVFIGRYVSDFRYLVVANGEVIVEDVKGMKTPLYRLKKKLVEAQYGIQIVEVR